MGAAVRGFVHGGGEPALARRSLRALATAGVLAVRCEDEAALALALRAAPGPAWVVQAGAWPIAFEAPPPSATGKPLLGFGAVIDPGGGEPAGGWGELLAATGGDLTQWPAGIDAGLPSVWTEAPAALAAQIEAGQALAGAARALAAHGHRAVRVPSLDVHYDERFRVAQVITALHRGGAERIAVSLTLGLRAAGDEATLVTLGRASRSTLPAPPGTIHVGERAPDRTRRAVLLAALVGQIGADVVHAHLLGPGSLRALAAVGVPVVVTLHNQWAGWPDGMAELEEGVCALWTPCSLMAREDAISAGLRGPVRTVWNGIYPKKPELMPAIRTQGREIRRSFRIPPEATVLLSVANYRPQKRLDALPAVLSALVRVYGLDAHLLVVGERERGPAAPVAASLRAAAKAHGVGHRVHEAGDQADVAPYYAASNLLLSVSEHEGLSLAQLEALSMGLAVVTSDVGGAREIERRHRQVSIVAVDAPPEEVADAVVETLATRREPASDPDARWGMDASFRTSKMVLRYRELYRRALAPPASPRGGLLLVTNNFSTGGAQSSARRLLLALHEAGVRVRVAVIQEQAAYPTPGRAALQEAGIPVLVAPDADVHDARKTARAVVDWADAEETAAVVLWNVIPEHKILIADLLLRTPVFDVSPGEMYFASLDRYLQQPRVGLPYIAARDYGALLAGVVVKYRGEAARAAEVLGAQVEVIPNGVPVPAQPPPRPPGRGRVVVGTLARIGPDKKLEQLLEAARKANARMPIWELRIAGAPERGAEKYAARMRALSEGLPVVWVGEAEPEAFLAGLDLFALVAEPAGCPNASLEAMASGLPVVATDVGGVREQVVDGETGMLVPRGNAGALAEALVELSRDERKRRAMGEAAFRRAVEEFSVKRMAERYAELCLGRKLGQG